MTQIKRYFGLSNYYRRKKIRFIFLILLFYCGIHTLHFIYTTPGQANAYLYWIQNALNNDNVDNDKPRQAKDFPYIPMDFHLTNTSICPERFRGMYGWILVNTSEISIKQVNTVYENTLKRGGSWEPRDCISKWKVAIIIPFRNRHEHLPILLRHIIPMLLAQHLSFTIFTINQADHNLFNRAMLLNVGFLEAMKIDRFDCFIFHDVDHIPENNRNYYGCTGMPRRFREKLDIYGYKLEYPTFFGGVCGVTYEQFRQVNGYSNQFWGWGGEDDDFYKRMKLRGFNISSPPSDYGTYSSIKHHHVQERQNLGRFNLMKNSKERNFIDGLNSIQYNKPNIILEPLYTNISVRLHIVKDLPTASRP